jgi:hypothetical protein
MIVNKILNINNHWSRKEVHDFIKYGEYFHYPLARKYNVSPT